MGWGPKFGGESRIRKGRGASQGGVWGQGSSWQWQWPWWHVHISIRPPRLTALRGLKYPWGQGAQPCVNVLFCSSPVLVGFFFSQNRSTRTWVFIHVSSPRFLPFLFCRLSPKILLTFFVIRFFVFLNKIVFVLRYFSSWQSITYPTVD